jgi:hypothetical protein
VNGAEGGRVRLHTGERIAAPSAAAPGDLPLPQRTGPATGPAAGTDLETIVEPIFPCPFQLPPPKTWERCPRTGLTMLHTVPTIMSYQPRALMIPDGSWPTGCKDEPPDQHVVDWPSRLEAEAE